MIKHIIKNTSWLFIAEAINKGTFFLITIIIARNFGSELFGQFNYAISFVIIFSVITDFGINNLVIREVARNKEKSAFLIQNGLIIKLFLSVLTLLLIFISTIFTSKSLEVDIMVYILSFYVVFNSYNTFSKSIYRAFEKMRFETFLKSVESVILLLHVLIVSIYIKDINILILGFTIASAITFFVSVKWIKKCFINFQLRFDKKIFLFLLKESWPFATINIFMVIYFNLDTVMLSFIRNDIETGLYSIAYNFIFIGALVPGLLNSSLYPVISRRINSLAQEKMKIIKYLIILLSSGMLLSFFLFIFGNFFISKFFGLEYIGSLDILNILLLSFPFLFFSNFMGTILSSHNKQLVNLYITATSVFINIGLNLALIKPYGASGAAVASVIAIIVMALLCLPYYINFIKNL